MAGENRRALRYLRLLLFDLARESLTEDNEGNEGVPKARNCSRLGAWWVTAQVRPGESKRDFLIFVSFCLIRSRQYHSGYALLEDRLMKVDE